MTIRYNCEKCGQLLKIKDDLAGTPNRCPTCKTDFIVPQASTGDSKPRLVPGPDSGVALAAAGPAASKSSPALPKSGAPTPPPVSAVTSPPDAVSSSAKIASPNKVEEFDPDAFLMEGMPKAGTASRTGPAPETGTANKPVNPKSSKPDFDPADFLMEGKPKKAAAPEVKPAPDPGKQPVPGSATPPAAAAPTDPPANGTAPPVNDFDPADFLMAEAAKKAAPAPEPVKGPGPATPPAPRRWGARASTAPPESAAAAAASATLAAATPATAGDPQLSDMPAAQPTLVKLPQETPREPINLGKALKDVGWRRWSLLALSLVGGTGLYWWLSQPKLELPPLGHVSGVVTLDGQPLAGAIVSFAPEKREYKVDRVTKGMPLRTALGVTDADGRYTLTYVERIPGTFLGTNRVSVLPLLDAKGRNRVPTAWGRESTNAIDVMEGSNPAFDISMKSK